MTDVAVSEVRRRVRQRNRDYTLLLLVSYPLFFADALVRRLAGPRPAGLRRSVFAEAKAAADRALPYAF